jgi:hypothetical protein
MELVVRRLINSLNQGCTGHVERAMIKSSNVGHIMSNAGGIISCKELFKTLKIVSVTCRGIVEILYYLKLNVIRLECN